MKNKLNINIVETKDTNQTTTNVGIRKVIFRIYFRPIIRLTYKITINPETYSKMYTCPCTKTIERCYSEMKPTCMVKRAENTIGKLTI